MPQLAIHAALFVVVFLAVLVARWPGQDGHEEVATVLAHPADAMRPRPGADPLPRPAAAFAQMPDDAASQGELPLSESPQFEPAAPAEVPLDELTGEPVVAELVRH